MIYKDFYKAFVPTCKRLVVFSTCQTGTNEGTYLTASDDLMILYRARKLQASG